MTQRARSPSSGSDDQKAKALESNKPTGVATAKPALLASSERSRGGQGMEGEERGRRHEGQRHQEKSGVTAATSGDADRPAQRGRQGAGAEHQPEVGGLVLPMPIG